MSAYDPKRTSPTKIRDKKAASLDGSFIFGLINSVLASSEFQVVYDVRAFSVGQLSGAVKVAPDLPCKRPEACH
jgi:hypothetical protein